MKVRLRGFCGRWRSGAARRRASAGRGTGRAAATSLGAGRGGDIARRVHGLGIGRGFHRQLRAAQRPHSGHTDGRAGRRLRRHHRQLAPAQPGTATASVLYPEPGSGQRAGPELSLPGARAPPAGGPRSGPSRPRAACSTRAPTTPPTTSRGSPCRPHPRPGATPPRPASATPPRAAPAPAPPAGRWTVPALPSLADRRRPPPRPLAIGASSALAELQSSSATSSSTTANGVAKATATATVSCVSLLGGLITVGSVTSSATATSNGTAAQLAGGHHGQAGAVLDGEPVTIDSVGHPRRRPGLAVEPRPAHPRAGTHPARHHRDGDQPDRLGEGFDSEPQARRASYRGRPHHHPRQAGRHRSRRLPPASVTSELPLFDPPTAKVLRLGTWRRWTSR